MLFLIPIGLAIWGVYLLRKWRGRWRYFAILPAVVIAADGVLLAVAGGYAAGTIVGLHVGASLLAFIIAGIHRGQAILDAAAKRSKR